MEDDARQEASGFTVKKKVDESWKNAVEKEKTVSTPLPEEAPPQPPTPGKPDFLYFVSGLGMQALAALGEIPDESGVAGAPDFGQAQYLIDVLEMLAVKTKNGLSAEEKTAFDELLYQLRLKFVQKTKALR